jgi:Ca-activated chloride channel family protein
VSALYAKLANPVLSDLKLKIEGCDTSELYPRAMPDLFHGGQITVLGRFKAAGKIAATLSGRLDNEEQTYRQDLVLKDSTDDAYLPRLWALRKVAFLLDEIRLRGENRELTDEIARLGKRHGILTPYTSFLIVEEDTPVPAAQRREILNSVQAAPGRFLGAREGRGAVADSAAIAVAKGAGSFAGDAGAPQVLGMAAAAGGSDEMEDRISDAARRTIRTLDGRTFYVKADGLWVESLCEERAREAAVIALWSDEFFHLVRLHPDIGRILTETRKVVLRVDGRILRIE